MTKPPKEELERKYLELGSSAKVGEYYEVNQKTALKWMEEDRIKTNKSPLQISREKKPSKEDLESKYKELGNNAVKVGEYYDVSHATAWTWMKDYGIKTGKNPNIKQALDGMLNDYIQGGK